MASPVQPLPHGTPGPAHHTPPPSGDTSAHPAAAPAQVPPSRPGTQAMPPPQAGERGMASPMQPLPHGTPGPAHHTPPPLGDTSARPAAAPAQ
ncbi:hypothetical protein K488DRAFT_92148, partial [Vararia minispora EC-137]